MMRSQQRLRRKKTRGFTLIELIMTVVLVGIVSVPLALLISSHVTGVTYSRAKSLAFNLARLDMEEVNNTAYAAIASANFVNYQGYNYNLSRTVTYAAGSGVSAESLKQITINVSASGGGSPLATLVTYIARNVSYGP